MAKSVDTKYSLTPEEKIFGVDPFKAASSTTLNNIVSKSDSFGGDFKNLLGVAGDVASTAGVISLITTGKLDKKYIMDKLGGTLKLDTSFLANTQIASAGKLLKSVGLIDDKTANLLSGKDSSMSLVDIYTTAHNGYKATVKNIKDIGDGFENIGHDLEKYIKDDLFDSFSNFTKALSSINPEIANSIKAMGLGEELALLTNVVNQTINLQIPGLIDSIVDDIKDKDVQKAVVAQTIPAALVAGNVEIMDIALDMLGASTIKGMYPDVIPDLLAGYKESADDVDKTLVERSTELFELLAKLDEKWAYSNREGQWVINLDTFKNMSTAAKMVVLGSNVTEYRTAAMIGGNFKPEKPLVIAKRYYPYI